MQIIGVAWELVTTIVCLTVFFATWNFVCVIYLSRLARSISLKPISDNSGDMTDHVEPTLFTVFSPLQNDSSLDSGSGPTFSDDDQEGRKGLDGEETVHDEDDSDVKTERTIVPVVVDPPYSIVIVCAISMNVMIQILLQAVLFSVLKLDMKTAYKSLAVVFLCSFLVYIASIVYYWNSLGNIN